MRVFLLAATAALAVAGYAVAAETANQKTDPANMSPQSSHPGVEGAPGGKSGPAAKNSGTPPSTAAQQNAPAGTNVPQASPGTDPTHDASGIKGAPGNKNGPSQKNSATGSAGTGGNSSTSAN